MKARKVNKQLRWFIESYYDILTTRKPNRSLIFSQYSLFPNLNVETDTHGEMYFEFTDLKPLIQQ